MDCTQKENFADTEIARREETLRFLVAAAHDAIIMMDCDGRIISWNPAAEEVFGYRQEEIVGQILHDIISPMRLRDASRAGLAQFAMSGKGAAIGTTLELPALHKNGTEFFIELSLSSLQIDGKWLATGIARDISERKLAEEALRTSTQRYQLLFESSRDALMTLEPPSWRFGGANYAALQLFGASSVAEFASLGPWSVSPECQPDGRLSSEKAQEAIATAMREGSYSFEWVHQRLDGTTFPADVLLTSMQVGKERSLQATVRDITERRRMEAKLASDLAALEQRNKDYKEVNDKLLNAQHQLLQSEKLAAIGLLASGVAHEINNPIGFVNSNLGTLKEYVDDLLAIIGAYEKAEAALPGAATQFGPAVALKVELDLPYLKGDLSSLIAESREGLERIKKIVQSLKDFSRVETRESFEEADLHLCIESTLNVVWNELKYKCEVRKEFGALPLVECNASHLNQVFMNLLVNAAHAIDEHGVVTLRTGCQGDEVWVEIADTGCGISPTHLTRIFDPFFTTKEIGKGTGLGLSISHGIIEEHQGRIGVTSEVGAGTTFRIWLPVKQPAKAAPSREA